MVQNLQHLVPEFRFLVFQVSRHKHRGLLSYAWIPHGLEPDISATIAYRHCVNLHQRLGYLNLFRVKHIKYCERVMNWRIREFISLPVHLFEAQ